MWRCCLEHAPACRICPGRRLWNRRHAGCRRSPRTAAALRRDWRSLRHCKSANTSAAAACALIAVACNKRRLSCEAWRCHIGAVVPPGAVIGCGQCVGCWRYRPSSSCALPPAAASAAKRELASRSGGVLPLPTARPPPRLPFGTVSAAAAFAASRFCRARWRASALPCEGSESPQRSHMAFQVTNSAFVHVHTPECHLR